jgi:hypothetical protein
MRWSLEAGAKHEAKFAALLREQLGALADVAELVVASFAAAVCDDDVESSAEAWIAALRETLLDCGLSDEPDDVLADLIGSMRRAGVIADVPEPREPLAVGSRVLALLAEDGEWHDAIVNAPLARHDDTRGAVYRVTFVEFGKPQDVSEDELVALDDVVADDDDGCALGEGECEICTRVSQLTFHHLIPRDTHARYVGQKRLPAGVVGRDGAVAEPTRIFLARHGMMICRPCHTHVHRIASNDELAERYNTPARVLAHAEMEKFISYASKQKVRLRQRQGVRTR